MGAVYEARQESLDRRVALKTLHAEYAKNQDAIARFFNEAKVLSRLEHPSIVQVSDFGNAADGTAFLVMEYLRGHSLGRRLNDLADRGERMSLLTALQICFQVADVLSVAHSQGIVHRDIKPDNLMLVADAVAPSGERVKLLDFGIAKLTDGQDKGGVKTATQQVMGTPVYMSPEQCSGAGGVDAKTDVYALGCVLFEALAGRPPFVAEGAGQLIGMHLFQEPPLLQSLVPKVPQAVSDLVQRMITKDKALRPSMTDAADDIAKLLSKLTGSGPVLRSKSHAVTDPDATKVQVSQPPSTTLGRSLGQIGGSSTKSKQVLAGAAIVLIGLGLAGALRLGSRSKEASTPAEARTAAVDTPTAAPATPAEPAKPATIQWKIDSVPSGSTVIDEAGQTLGVTPLLLSREPESGELLVRVRKAGYQDAKLVLHRDQDDTRQVGLVRNSAPQREPAHTRTGTPSSANTATKKPPPERIGYEE